MFSLAQIKTQRYPINLSDPVSEHSSGIRAFLDIVQDLEIMSFDDLSTIHSLIEIGRNRIWPRFAESSYKYFEMDCMKITNALSASSLSPPNYETPVSWSISPSDIVQSGRNRARHLPEWSSRSIHQHSVLFQVSDITRILASVVYRQIKRNGGKVSSSLNAAL
jgi:hypothetical protein